jgi:hypothetical protein
MLCMLPLIMPSVWLLVSCYANAWLYCLFDAQNVPVVRSPPRPASAGPSEGKSGDDNDRNDNDDDDDDDDDDLAFEAMPPKVEVYVPRGPCSCASPSQRDREREREHNARHAPLPRPWARCCRERVCWW